MSEPIGPLTPLQADALAEADASMRALWLQKVAMVLADRGLPAPSAMLRLKHTPAGTFLVPVQIPHHDHAHPQETKP